MTLTEIKNKIIERIYTLTIDDFYSDPENNIAKQEFSELTNLQTDEEIEAFLHNTLPEVIIEPKRSALEKELKKIANETEKVRTLVSSLGGKIEKLNTRLEEKKQLLQDIPFQEKKFKEGILILESEILKLESFSNDAELKKGIEKKKTDLIKMKSELDKLTANFKALELETGEIAIRIKPDAELYNSKELELRKLQIKFKNKEEEIIALNELEFTYFESEYESLEFLFKVVLKKTIEKQPLYRNKETGVMEHNYYGYNSKFWEKTDEFVLETSEYEGEKYYEFISNLTCNNLVIPSNWREVLLNILSNSIPNITGTISKVDCKRSNIIIREEEGLTYLDLAALLAAKVAVKQNYSIKTNSNILFLPLSGGIAAEIRFRFKGEIISKYQLAPIEIFANLFSQKRFERLSIYSYISVQTPGAYYILDEKYVIEVSFLAAPILIGDNIMASFAPNVAGVSIAKKEEEAAEAARKQKEDDDDYYERFHDDD
jgi:hypothetical protein